MTEYKHMTVQEFRDVLEKIGLEDLSWEAILNKMSLLESYKAVKYEKEGFCNIAKDCRKKQSVLHNALAARGYYESDVI